MRREPRKGEQTGLPAMAECEAPIMRSITGVCRLGSPMPLRACARCWSEMSQMMLGDDVFMIIFKISEKFGLVIDLSMGASGLQRASS